MMTIIVTGGIGSGKSVACDFLASLGAPVYDSDSRTKSLYREDHALADRIDAALGGGLILPDGTLDLNAMASKVFSDRGSLETLESIVHPAVLEDFKSWRDAAGSQVVVLESAIALRLPEFLSLADEVLAIDAPLEMRIQRALRRDSSDPQKVRDRIAAQPVDLSRADHVIINDGSKQNLYTKMTDYLLTLSSSYPQLKNLISKMKTDLARILSVSGHSGLYKYLAQARNGAIAECLADGKRTVFDMRSRISTLADISIYTNEGELRLKEVFEKMHEALGEDNAPSSKASADELKAFFAKAVPDYDGDRFYVSHMKKVVDWYNDLKAHASLEFLEEGEEPEAEPEETEE